MNQYETKVLGEYLRAKRRLLYHDCEDCRKEMREHQARLNMILERAAMKLDEIDDAAFNKRKQKRGKA